jgi:hypothetical protein
MTWWLPVAQDITKLVILVALAAFVWALAAPKIRSQLHLIESLRVVGQSCIFWITGKNPEIQKKK